jgi:2-amino-4-hydroxy-6-hydroxymethyldihydropteridine diphosphokinase
MILIGIGGNVSGPWGAPRETVTRAIDALDRGPCRVLRASRLLITAPFGKPNQPPFVNAVARVATHLPPEALMRHLHAIERAAGRRRGIVWGPRTLDLDLLDYRGLIRNRSYPMAGGRRPLLLPHPGIAERIFVLTPIAEIAPRWRHPLGRQSAAALLRRLVGAREGAEIREPPD